ncbi:TPA: IS3 family transposase [Staphylococcus aureus]|nr:IS3 family transposase [Staphylococcus aureus]
MKFENLEQLEAELFDYVNWYNNFRPHSSVQCLTPVAFKGLHMKSIQKIVNIPRLATIAYITILKDTKNYVKLGGKIRIINTIHERLKIIEHRSQLDDWEIT